MNEVTEAVMDELEQHGATVLRFENGGKHGRVYFRHGGRERFYVVPLSASDRRAAMNARSDVRKLLGVKRKVHKNPNRKPKRKAERPVKCPTGIGVGKDWQAALKDHPLAQPKETAWQRFTKWARGLTRGATE